MESLERRLRVSLERVSKLVHDEMTALLSEAVNTPLDLSHPQFGALAARVARLSSGVEAAYRQAAVELIAPHLQYEDVDAQARLGAMQSTDSQDALQPSSSTNSSTLAPLKPLAGPVQQALKLDQEGLNMIRSASSATRLLAQCTQEGLGMPGEEGDEAGHAASISRLAAASTTSADRLRKLAPGAAGSVDGNSATLAQAGRAGMEREPALRTAVSYTGDRSSNSQLMGASPTQQPQKSMSGGDDVVVLDSSSGSGAASRGPSDAVQSQPLRATASANHTSVTSLSSPTGGAQQDMPFTGSTGGGSGNMWMGGGSAVPQFPLEAMIVKQAADSQPGSREGLSSSTQLGPQPPMPLDAQAQDQQYATQEYLKSVHAALSAANLVMGDANSINSLTETLQRAAALKQRDPGAAATSQGVSEKLMQLTAGRPMSGDAMGHQYQLTPQQSVEVQQAKLVHQLSQQGVGLQVDKSNTTPSNSRPLSPYSGQEVHVMGENGNVIVGTLTQDATGNTVVVPKAGTNMSPNQLAQMQNSGYVTYDEQGQPFEVQRGGGQAYAGARGNSQQLQLPIDNLALSTHRPSHNAASQHNIQMVDFLQQQNNSQNLSQNMLTLNAAGMISGMPEGSSGPLHTMSGPLPVVQGDTIIMEPLTSYVPDPNFSLFDLQPQNGQPGGYNPNSAQQTLSMFAAAASAEQQRGGLGAQGNPPLDLQNGPSFTTLNLGSMMNSAGQLVNIGAPGGNAQITLQPTQHGDGAHSEPLPLLVNLNQVVQGGTLAAALGPANPGLSAASISTSSLLSRGGVPTLSPGQSPDTGLMSAQAINLAGLLPSGVRVSGGIGVPQRTGMGVTSMGGLNLMGGVPVSPLPLRVQDLPGRFKILPPMVQQRILALCRTNPVIGVRDFDDKVVSKLSLLVDSWGVDQALAMLDHLEHRMRTKQGAMKNGPGYLDVAVCSHLDMLKAQGACPKSMKLEDYAQHVLAPAVFHELCQAVTTNRWLAWEHFDQGIVQLIKKLPTDSAVEKLQEITYHSFKNVDNIKGCIMSILNSKIREDRRRQ